MSKIKVAELFYNNNFIDFNLTKASNYAFDLIVKEKYKKFTEKLMQKMIEEGIKFRRGSAGSGNQSRQPYLQNILPKNYYKNLPVTKHDYFYKFYIGNFPTMTVE